MISRNKFYSQCNENLFLYAYEKFIGCNTNVVMTPISIVKQNIAELICMEPGPSLYSTTISTLSVMQVQLYYMMMRFDAGIPCIIQSINVSPFQFLNLITNVFLVILKHPWLLTSDVQLPLQDRWGMCIVMVIPL